LNYLVSDVPKTVKLAIEREQYFTRLALDDEEPALDEMLDDFDDDDDDSDEEEEEELDIYKDGYDEKKHLASECANPEGEGSKDHIHESEILSEEDEEELKALASASGCGCAAHGDGVVGTSLGGFEGTWMNRFRQESNPTAARRRLRRRVTSKIKEFKNKH
jgi:hypothetical protein